jgi:predicted metalloendopeptidase
MRCTRTLLALGSAHYTRYRAGDERLHLYLDGNHLAQLETCLTMLPNLGATYAAFQVEPSDRLFIPIRERLHLW